jgi:regulator of protease activity HflC (stomatin/prohibitin superfamily)
MLVVIILLGSLLIVTLFSFVNVPVGYKGVVTSAPDSNYIGHTFDQGWHFNPYLIFCHVEMIRFNTQTIEYSTATVGEGGTNYGPINVRSMDNLELNVSLTITFHIDADKVSHLRVQYGDYTTTILMQVARSTPRDVASHYMALDMAGPLRPLYEQQIALNITQRLANYDITVEMVNLRQIQLPPDVDAAVQQKKVSEQQYIAAQYQKNRTIVLAEGTARAVVINATAQAQAIWIRANGSAEAVQTVMNQLKLSDPNANVTSYLTWLYLQALTDPNSNIEYIIVTDGTGVPIILNPTGG